MAREDWSVGGGKEVGKRRLGEEALWVKESRSNWSSGVRMGVKCVRWVRSEESGVQVRVRRREGVRCKAKKKKQE